MTTRYRNLNVNGDLDKSSFGRVVERESLTGTSSRESARKVTEDNENL